MKKIFLLLSMTFIYIESQLFAVTIVDDTVSGVDRYAVYVGCNYGGKSRERLLYAGSDAQSFKNTMAEIGGVTDSNSRILIDPTKDNIDSALSEISNAITQSANNSKRSEFIFYYSGHSDENALLLGEAKYDYSKLKAAISAVPSDIHVVILDSCYSGNFIRTKGGQKRKPFLIDDSSVVTGHAYLSSSSDNESSQESDEIESSYFTNAMITGLRGAADTSGDSKVTLNELYSYAFNDTLSKTESSKAGPQHPNYNITLVGSGDLILSDLSTAESMLSLSKEAKGKFIIRDANDKLISEINKIQGQPIFMALPSGQYSALIIDEYSTKQGTFLLEKDQVYVLDQNSLSSIKRKSNRLRGDSTNSENVEKLSKAEKVGEYLTLDDLEDTKQQKNNEFDEEDLDNDFLDTDDLIFDDTAKENSSENENSTEENDEDFDFNFDFTDITPFSLQFCPGIEIVNPNEKTTLFSVGIIGSYAQNIGALQGSTVFNIANGNVFGAQIAGVFNIANEQTMGGQVSGLFNIGHNMVGAQVAGGFNLAKNIRGSQVAGFGNIAEKIDGSQVAGFGNCARTVEGAQVSGAFNGADNVNGIQVSGFINGARQVSGIQIGLINVAEENSGITLGLINWVGNGLRDFCVAIDTDDCIDIFYQGGTKHLFTTLGLTKYRTDYFEEEGFGSLYVGLGAELPLKKASIDFECLWKMVFSAELEDEFNYDTQKYSEKEIEEKIYSLTIPSFKVTLNLCETEHSRIFASCAFDVNVADWNDYAFELYKKTWIINGDDGVNISPTFSFGAKIKL